MAERTDGRGVALAYRYDDQDRLAEIAADIPQSVDTNGSLLNVDTNAVGLAYAHTADGLLETAAIEGRAGELNRVALAYDGGRQLATATQSVAGLVDRTVEYAWDYGTNGAAPRLTTVAYGPQQAMSLSYGQPGSIGDALSQVEQIGWNGAPVATYRRMGLGRLLGIILANGIGCQYDGGTPGSPVSGLDGFGRVVRQEWNGTGLLLGYEYGYDAAGNRKFARVSNWPVEDQDWRYQYDGLDRLRTALRGTLDADNWSFKEPFVPEATQWTLDELGNWSGDGQERRSVLTFRDVDQDGEWDSPETFLGGQHHGVNQANEIEELITTDGVSPAVAEDFVYDAAGNLVFDGERFYRYDAWNRLAAVHLAGTLEVQPDGTLTGSPGKRVYRYEYDALGRRVQTVRWMYRGDQVTRHVYGSGAAVLAEYDVTSNGVGGYDETPARWFVHGEGFPDPVMEISETGGPPQYLYYLKDALGSVGALADTNGEVVERYTYTPYGQTSVYAANGAPRQSSAFGNPFAFTGQRYEPVTGLYHFWARSYDPRLGRWLQRDPVGLLSLRQPRPAFSLDGAPPACGSDAETGIGSAPDGASLYSYANSAPLTATDPTGEFLFVDTLVSSFDEAALRGMVYAQMHPLAMRIALGVVAALNMYALATNDDYFDTVAAQPDFANMLRADMMLAINAGRQAGNLLRTWATSLPQGISQRQLQAMIQIIRRETAHIGGQLGFQGSRAIGTATGASDLDFAIRVSPDKFKSMIEELRAGTNAGSAARRTIEEAAERGRIFAREAGLRQVRNEAAKAGGVELDLSVIEEGGLFDVNFVPIAE